MPARRYDVDFEASVFVVTVVLGLLIRLANDCELLDSWSSGTDFCRCVAREPGIRVASAAASRAVLVLSAEYCDLFAGPPAVCDAPGPTDASLDGVYRGIAFRTIEPFCDVCDVCCWSNFFFRSFTLWCETPLYPTGAAVGLAAELSGRSSTGSDADRSMGRIPLPRGAERGGCLGVVPLVVAREEGICRPLEIAEAMEKALLGGNEGCWPPSTVCAPG